MRRNIHYIAMMSPSSWNHHIHHVLLTLSSFEVRYCGVNCFLRIFTFRRAASAGELFPFNYPKLFSIIKSVHETKSSRNNEITLYHSELCFNIQLCQLVTREIITKHTKYSEIHTHMCKITNLC